MKVQRVQRHPGSFWGAADALLSTFLQLQGCVHFWVAIDCRAVSWMSYIFKLTFPLLSQKA